MADMRELHFQTWSAGKATNYAPTDALFLQAATNAGLEAFTHTGGLFGARAAQRAVHIIHRGRGKTWEVIFLEHDSDVVTTTTTDLEQMTTTMLSWLTGKPLTAKQNSIRAAAG